MSDVYTDRDLRDDVNRIVEVFEMTDSTVDEIVENLRTWGVQETGHVVPARDIPDRIFWKVVFRAFNLIEG